MANIPEEHTADEGQASNDQIREMDSIVNAMEGEVSTGCSVFVRPNDGEMFLCFCVDIAWLVECKFFIFNEDQTYDRWSL